MPAGLFYSKERKKKKFQKIPVSPEPVTLPALKKLVLLPREINPAAADGGKAQFILSVNVSSGTSGGALRWRRREHPSRKSQLSDDEGSASYSSVWT